MDNKSQAKTEAKAAAESRTALLLGLIFGGMIVIMIAGMLAFDMYGEKHTGSAIKAPADAADR
jgi:hypothetical protein